MTHKAKIDWWIPASLILGVLSPFAGARLWITIPLFLALAICGYPQQYETTDSGLLIRTGLTRQIIPYETIRFIGPAEEGSERFAFGLDRVRVRYGAGAEALISPRDRNAFLADMAWRSPHLIRRGYDLIETCA